MTTGADPAACVLARSELGQQQDKQETANYQMNLPLNWICRPKTPAR
jgi:hypothetical protein